MKTDIITYNLADRGRTLGMDRDYQKPENMPGIIAAINSEGTQERVKHGDMRGFYTHLPRILFGTKTEGCGVTKGKYMCVEPALRTTLLKGYEDGTVEHQAEFMPTQAGEMCFKLHQKGFGGFSSAILEHASPPEFVGFDYVPEPNFSTNRGYSLTLDALMEQQATLDSVTDCDCEGECEECKGDPSLDIVMQAYSDQFAGMQATLDSLQSMDADRQLIEEAMMGQEQKIRALQEEREQLYSILEGRGFIAPGVDMTLDNIVTELPLPESGDNYISQSAGVIEQLANNGGKIGDVIASTPAPKRMLSMRESFNSRPWLRG